MIIFGLLALVFLVIGLFLWFISYSKTTDVSQDEQFKAYIDKPLIVQQTSSLIRGDEKLNRFSAYYIDVPSDDPNITDERILKKYSIGDTIIFTAAKRYFSYHVGNSFYLFGNATLDSGEVIEFQYGVSFDYMPAIWETLEEFLERRKLKTDFP